MWIIESQKQTVLHRLADVAARADVVRAIVGEVIVMACEIRKEHIVVACVYRAHSQYNQRCFMQVSSCCVQTHSFGRRTCFLDAVADRLDLVGEVLASGGRSVEVTFNHHYSAKQHNKSQNDDYHRVCLHVERQ